MDGTDSKIIEILKKNGRATISEIGKIVRLSVPAVAERIRKMEEAGLIEGYRVKINREKSDYKLLAFIFVGVDKTEQVESFRQAMVQCKSVLECHHIAGEYDYLLKVLLEDTKQLEDFLSHKLKKAGGVSKSNTVVVLSSLKEEINV